VGRPKHKAFEGGASPSRREECIVDRLVLRRSDGTMSTVQTVFLTVNTVKITLVRRSCTSLKCILEVEVEQVRTCASSFLALFLEIRYSYIMRDVITKINSIPFTQLTL